MEKKEEKIFRDIVKILEQDVPQEALAEGNPTPEQEAIALIQQELDKAREEGYENGVKDGMKGRVFKKVHITEEYKPFKNRGELENFLSKLSGEGKWQDD